MVTYDKAAFKNAKILNQTNRSIVYTTLVGTEVLVLKSQTNSNNSTDEFDILSTLSHPNIVTLKGTVDGVPGGIVLEYLPCGDLRHFLDVHSRPGAAKQEAVMRRKMITDVIKGLVYLHAAGIVHRDIKTRNIFLCILDGLPHAKIGDFDAARKVNPATQAYQSTADVPVGTYGYLAPEIFDKPDKNQPYIYSAKSDIFSMGMVILSTLSDDFKPNKKNTYIEKDFPFSKEVSEETRKTFLLCYKKDPAERISAKELLEQFPEPDVSCKSSKVRNDV